MTSCYLPPRRGFDHARSFRGREGLPNATQEALSSFWPQARLGYPR